jgi:hypothetical protein
MPFATFAAGPYTATYNTDAAPGNPPGKGLGPRDLGLVEGVRRWRRVMQARDVRASAFGDSVIDAVYRGGQCFCLMTFKEWSAAARAALWPFSSSFGEVGAIGRLLTDLAGVLTLTAVPNTPAAQNGPAILVFGKAILSPEHVSEVSLGNQERDVPIVLRCFPYVTAQGKVVWFEEA